MVTMDTSVRNMPNKMIEFKPNWPLRETPFMFLHYIYVIIPVMVYFLVDKDTWGTGAPLFFILLMYMAASLIIGFLVILAMFFPDFRFPPRKNGA